MLANAMTPLLGLVDTAVIGHFGSTAELAALAVATIIFNFIFWSFGFLRMGTTGFVARAEGAKDSYSVALVTLRSMLIALAAAIALLLLQSGILFLAIYFIAPPDNIIPNIHDYFYIRIWGAPATLTLYVISGVLIGRGNSGYILKLQLFLNGCNAIFDIFFAGFLGWGVEGIAWGTVLAEYLTLLVAILLIARTLPWSTLLPKIKLPQLWEGDQLRLLLAQNRDILIRTLFLLLSFSFFTHISSRFGDTQLAANHILLQIISFSAFFLDGFAHVLESLVGQAIGKQSKTQFNQALSKSSILALLVALMLALIVISLGQTIIAGLTNITEVRVAAVNYLPYIALYIALSVAAFQLDGLFIGASYGSVMRNASIASTSLFLVSWYLFFNYYGNAGLWLAFTLYVAIRAISLLLYVPKLKQQAFPH